MGAAILAGVACGIYESVEKACDQLITSRDSTDPKAEEVAVYEKYHRLYQKVYTSLKMIIRSWQNYHDQTDKCNGYGI